MDLGMLSTENPRVSGSIPFLGISFYRRIPLPRQKTRHKCKQKRAALKIY